MAPVNSIKFDEIRDGNAFEHLVADYFREFEQASVSPPAKGPDGGRDIVVTFDFNDPLVPFNRKWVVQCKFREETISKKHIAETNVPTLIHEYGADGYLLVCKGDVGKSLASSFENLNRECKLGYNYVIWTGSHFLMKLNLVPPVPLIKTYFPNYYEFLQTKEDTE